ncbi:UNVERIFIED_CONTAM: hypothetical protein NCL1_20796 [Trichonephila clavipes]
MGSFHHRFPTESGEFASFKSGFRRLHGFPSSFRRRHLTRAPSKNQSLRGGGASQPLSLKKLCECEGLTPAPSKTQSFIAARGFNTAPSKTPSFLLTLSLPLYIHRCFFPFPLLSDSALLNCCHSTDPIRSDAFHI